MNKIFHNRLGSLLLIPVLALPFIKCTEKKIEIQHKLTANETLDISSNIEKRVWDFYAADTARNADEVIALLWPDFSMMGDGKRASYKKVVNSSKEFMSSLILFHTEWNDIEITPLSKNIALSSFVFRDSLITKAGNTIRSKGPTTFIWQKREQEWRIIFADADHYPVE